MKVTELRIGNIIGGTYTDYDDGSEKYDVCKVVALDSVGAAEYPIWVQGNANVEKYDSFDPVPLTDEWLIKLGFKYLSEHLCWNKNEHDVSFYSSGVIEFIPFGDDCYPVHIKYVHQLQNIYFALRGEELHFTL